MRSSWAILLAASISTVAGSVPFYDQSRNLRPIVASDVKALDTSVPGKNPLNFCDDNNQEGYSVKIENVDLDPNPPKTGTKLTITAKGTVTKEIVPGSTCNIVVKYGLIKLLNQNIDMCEQMANVDMQCPIKEGQLSIQKDVEIPNEVPPGTYTVTADCWHPDGETAITCLKATVSFTMGFFGRK